MASGRFSEKRTRLDLSTLPSAIREAHLALCTKLGRPDLPVLHWNDVTVVIPVELAVDLPSRGPVHGVDIREDEPVILQFHLHEYPARAPWARSDRRDFPADSLPHL